MNFSDAIAATRGKTLAIGFLIALALAAGAWPARAQTPTPQDYVFIEFLLSAQGAVIGGGFGVLLTDQVLTSFFPCGEDPAEQAACRFNRSFQALCLGSAWGLPLGATLGLALAERLLELDGSLAGALLGGLLGELVGLPECSLVNLTRYAWLRQLLPLSPAANADLSVIVNPVMLSALGATMGFNLGGVRLGEGHERTALAIPLVALRWRF